MPELGGKYPIARGWNSDSINLQQRKCGNTELQIQDLYLYYLTEQSAAYLLPKLYDPSILDELKNC